jgi:hypothetical protein
MLAVWDITSVFHKQALVCLQRWRSRSFVAEERLFCTKLLVLCTRQIRQEKFFLKQRRKSYKKARLCHTTFPCLNCLPQAWIWARVMWSYLSFCVQEVHCLRDLNIVILGILWSWTYSYVLWQFGSVLEWPIWQRIGPATGKS